MCSKLWSWKIISFFLCVTCNTINIHTKKEYLQHKNNFTKIDLHTKTNSITHTMHSQLKIKPNKVQNVWSAINPITNFVLKSKITTLERTSKSIMVLNLDHLKYINFTVCDVHKFLSSHINVWQTFTNLIYVRFLFTY